MVFQSLIYLLTIFINLKSIQKILNLESYKIASYLLFISMLAVNYQYDFNDKGELIHFVFDKCLDLFFNRDKKLKFSNYKKFVLTTGFLISMIALSRQWFFIISCIWNYVFSSNS